MRKIILFATLTLFLLACGSNRAIVREAERAEREAARIEREEFERAERDKIQFEKFYNEEGIVFALVDVKPAFNGDYTGAEFRDFLMSNVRYPLEALVGGISGRVIVGFVIDIDGAIVNARVIRSLHPALDAEVVRVVMSSPKWIPGIHDGETVRVKHSIPFTFQNLGVINRQQARTVTRTQ